MKDRNPETTDRPAVRDIDELNEQLRLQKESLSTLLNHMPAMTFSKDVETGVYLACNQSFAEYCHKETPEGVVGLTDFEIFEHSIAAKFVEDDKKALSMDRPYVLYEDVADAVGNPRQFQTTKLKFYDESGRLCLLGMSMDVTEMERVRRESEQAKAAYREAVSVSEVYGSIVEALSEDYFNLYYVDLETGDYIEYGLRTEAGHRGDETRGKDFFAAARRNARLYIYEEDQELFISSLEKETLLKEVRKHGTFILQYRLLINGEPAYVNLKATYAGEDDRHLIIGVNNIDTQMKDRAAARRAYEERKSYQRFSALNNNLIVLYFVDPQTDRYTEFSATRDFEELGIAKAGDDFFRATYENSLRTVHPEDQEMFHSQVTKEKVLDAISRDGVFLLDYRLMTGDLPTYVRLKAAQLEEDGKTTLIIGLMDEDAQIRREKQIIDDLSQAKRMATEDALTGAKNKYAYDQWEEIIDTQIDRGEQEPFAVVVCDINNMKVVNDLYGHNEGDEYIRRACSRIRGVFSHSPVFRVGGDEFAVLLMGEDYVRRRELMKEIDHDPSGQAGSKIGETLSAGMVEYRKDRHFSLKSVFAEADMAMYERKQFLKRTWMTDGTHRQEAEEGLQVVTRKYELPPEQREVISKLKVPFAVYQFVNRSVVTLVLSEGFCDLFGYEDRVMAYLDMDHDMYKDTHPEDVKRIAEEAFRFATEGGNYEVLYRTRVKGGSGYRIIHAFGEHVYTEDDVRLAQVWYSDEGSYTEGSDLPAFSEKVFG